MPSNQAYGGDEPDEPRLEIDREAFRTWLIGFIATEPVGYPSNSVTCPLARFMGHPIAPTEQNLPPWADEFVEYVDDNPHDEPITASEALAYLDKSS